MTPASTISIIVACGRNRGIGKDNSLLWRIPADMKRFKELTMGHPVIMGRKTFDSILATLGKPLPGRTNVVVTHNKEWSHEGVHAVESLEEAFDLAKHKPGGDEMFVIGGGQIYEQSMMYADKIYLTMIDAEKESDVFFPEYHRSFKYARNVDEGEYDGLKYTFMTLSRE